MDATRNVTVVRPFCMEGQRKEVGELLDVPRPLAVELVNMAKAVYTPEPATVLEQPVQDVLPVPSADPVPELPDPVVAPEPAAPVPAKRK